MFDVFGPRVVSYMEGARGGRHIGGDEAAQFWEDNEDLADCHGCYVFGLRSGGGVTPWYVGRAAQSTFQGECFAPHKLEKYNWTLTMGGVGTPVLLFVVYPEMPGPPSKWAIEELETYLIQSAYRRNNDLLNRTKRGVQYWGIRGLIGPFSGRRSDPAKVLGKALWLLE